MYFNNVNIIYYLIVAVIGFAEGKFVAWCSTRFIEEKKIFSKEFFEKNKEGLKYNYVFMLLMALINIAILYKFGFGDTFFKNLDLIKFLILAPMLVISFYTDVKDRILPNRINLIMFEAGLLFTFLYGLNDINTAKDMLLGGLVGAGIFGLITLLGGLIAGKEAMGMGDVKFMGAIGLYYGVIKTLEISLFAFAVAAVFSVGLIIVRLVKKQEDPYIPFGPFLVLGSFFCIFAPVNTVLIIFYNFCKGISDLLMGSKE